MGGKRGVERVPRRRVYVYEMLHLRFWMVLCLPVSELRVGLGPMKCITVTKRVV